ncbi:MAG: TolC family protein [Gemmatimonadetes bacterium]|nr:TolC family protein [Gemmatimonadota bacterium]
MQRMLWLVVSAALLWPAPLLAQNPELAGGPISLEQALRFALDRNPRLASARYTADAAAAHYDYWSRSRLPNVTLSGLYETFPAESKLQTMRHMDIPRTAGPEMLDFFRRQFQPTVYNVQAAVSVPIYTGGQLGSRIAAADYLAEAAEASATSTRDDIVFGVTSVYLNVLRLQKVVAATEAAVRSLEESARVVEQRVEAGSAPLLDLYRVRTRLANTRQELTRRTGALAKAKTHLLVLMGVEDVLQAVTLSDTLTYVPRDYDLRAAVAETLRRRPEFVAQSHMVHARSSATRAAQAGYLPQVSFNAFYKQAYGTRADMWRDDAGVFVNVSLGFLDPVLSSQVREARAAEHAEEQRLQQLRLEIVRQVETAFLDRGEAEKRIGTAEAALREAREALRIEELKLETGKGVINDLLDAQADLLEAEVNDANALADYNIADVALRKAIGEIELPR